jgi:hypothetical protein
MHGTPKRVNAAPYIRKNFSWIIDYNFARLGAARCSTLVDSLSEYEIQDLAALYWTSVASNGRAPMALDVLANRLSGAQLAKVSNAFGFEPVYAAVVRAAPHKSNDFLAVADTRSVAPYLSGDMPLPSKAAMAAKGAQGVSAPDVGSNNIFLDYTIEQIYLSFRTAPVGSLSVPAALFSTGVFVVQQIGLAFSFGFALGTLATLGLQNYAPGAWMFIVDNVGGWLYDFTDAWNNSGVPGNPLSPEEIGGYQMDGADAFGVEGWAQYEFSENGGDYDVCQEWDEMTEDAPEDGGGCGNNLDECPTS